jgi:hypothetical protein
MDRNWRTRVKLRECNTYKYGSTDTSGTGMQHGSHINTSLQFFFSNKPCRKIYARNAVLGPLFIAINAGKRQFGKPWMRK